MSLMVTMDTSINITDSELKIKMERIRRLLDQNDLDALLLRQTSNFAWATCGAPSYINIADSIGCASLLITPSSRTVLTNNIEASRLTQEYELEKQGWEFQVSSWFGDEDKVSKYTSGMKLGADTYYPNALNLSAELVCLRSQLTPEEGVRFKKLGAFCAQGMWQTVKAIRPGMDEYEIAGIIAQAVESRGVQAVVNLVATDERIFAFRHPLPTSKTLQRYAMLIFCGRKWGLICSITRLVHFGPLPAEIRRKEKATAQIDAAIIAATRPNYTMGDIFHIAQSAYASAGFPEEWKFHHQGGSAGYAPREITAKPSSMQPITLGQAYAWNPSITGVKSEDTFIVGDQGNEILTDMENWPFIEVEIGDQKIHRPAILEI
jgi:Xaa-Pro aminopeptidase